MGYPLIGALVLSVSGQVTTLNHIIATGGVVTIDGDYKIHTFNGSDTFDVVQVGLNPLNKIEYIIIAGGGAGGGSEFSTVGSINGAGGGAGGYLSGSNYTISVQSYPVIIGAGGTISLYASTNGSNSSFDSLTAIGGGRGGLNSATQSALDGAIGGSGGGAGGYIIAGFGGAGTIGQGNQGGSSTGLSPYASGGGGGSSAAGGNGGTNSGDGGAGTASSISGASVTRAGGGGGGTYDELCLPGTGGTGGGGTGANGITPATPGTINTGGGGGGGSYKVGGGASAANGGSGVVIIRYKYQN